ncbi:MAG: alcohol dehydrogenase-like regulatory protein ErcA [Bacillota bacterium]
MVEKNSLELRKFFAPEFLFGLDSRQLVGQYAKNLSAKKVLIVTDSGIISAGWVEDVKESLAEYNIDSVVYKNISSNPRDYEVMKGVEKLREEDCNFIAAVGGGSPMDCAKGIGIVATNGGHILDYEGVDKIEVPSLPLVCIPTTAGTAAEISQFSIVLDTTNNTKVAIVSKAVVPDAALIDPLPLSTMDYYLTACTGMDALTHAIEAYVSNAHSSVSDVHALKAINLIIDNLVHISEENNDINLLNNLMLGSLHAGLAFSNASLGAVHAMAHSLGGKYDLPHGECNSILLEHVIAYNFEYAASRYIDIAQAMGIEIEGKTDKQIKKILTQKVSSIREQLDIPAQLTDVEATADDISILVDNAMNDSCMVTNPVAPDKDDLEGIYEKIIV